VGHQVVARNDAWTDATVSKDATLVAFHDAAKSAVATSTSARMQSAWVPTDEAIKKTLRGGDPRAALAESHRRFDDAVKPPPPPASPVPALVGLGWILLFASWRIVRNTRIAEVRASLPAYRYTAHAFVVVGVLVVLPLLAGAATSLFAGTRDDFRYVGFANYLAILTARGGELLGHGSFYLTLLVTVLWTVLNVVMHVGIGVLLGVLLSRPIMRLRGVYRALLVLPWAVPSYVTALAWKGMFHRQFGAVNALLGAFGVEPISWFSKFSTSLTANVTTNVWLGFPFMMVVTLGALTSISKEVLEAAEVDGCTRWQRFWRVTLPLLRPALLPAVVLGAIWTFNMFNVVFLVSGGEPDGTTDILVSDAYRWAFTRDAQYGYAAAYAVLIFGLLWLMTKASSKISEKAV
jgi:arabinogalactan oligomer/maltooligosaccharide transport system permease protein